MTDQELMELLPWYANGTLDPEEQRAVESYLERAPEARLELAELSALQSVVATVAEQEPEFNPQGIREVLRQVDAYERGQRNEAGTLARVQSWLQRAFESWQITPLVPRLALATQLVLIVALGAALMLGPSATPDTTTAGGPVQVGPSGGALLQLGFAPDATEQALRALLQEYELEIVAGPSAQQLYTVEITGPEERSPETLGATLRQRSDLIRYAEPVR